MSHAKGEELPQTKLTSNEVRDIKDELINGTLTYKQLAQKYDIGWGCIRDISNGKIWKHIPFPEGEINQYTYRFCKLCGDRFKTDRFVKGGKPEKYCSDQCRKHQEVLWTEDKTFEEHFGIYKGICECCGEEYEVDLSVRLEGKNVGYFSKKYCSKKCQKRQSYLNGVGKTYEEVYGTIEKECAFCGQLFELGPDDYKGQKYCRSEECDRARERHRSSMRRWNGKGYWDREGKNDRLQRNYT